METLELSNLELQTIDFQSILEPFIVERYPVESPEWKNEIKVLSRKWKRRMWKRKFFGWLPHGENIPRIFRGSRTQDYVRSSYDTTWGARAWPETKSEPVRKKLIRAEWQNEGMLVRQGGLPRVHLQYIAQAISVIQPRSVLEVGAGDGLNLFVLAGKFPDIAWNGVELTQNGVNRAQAVQKESMLPGPLAQYCPWPLVDQTAHRKIIFQQGDATNLSYTDSSFGLVLTRQALEQMDMVRDKALKEIARVAGQYVLMIEPFADFNQDSLRKSYVRAKDYFSLQVSQLPRFGIEPISVFHAFPQNITLGLGLVLGRVQA